MACVNWIRSSSTAIFYLFSQETDLLIKVIMKCVNIKLWDILGCFRYILNPLVFVYSMRIMQIYSEKQLKDIKILLTILHLGI